MEVLKGSLCVGPTTSWRKHTHTFQGPRIWVPNLNTKETCVIFWLKGQLWIPAPGFIILWLYERYLLGVNSLDFKRELILGVVPPVYPLPTPY